MDMIYVPDILVSDGHDYLSLKGQYIATWADFQIGDSSDDMRHHEFGVMTNGNFYILKDNTAFIKVIAGCYGSIPTKYLMGEAWIRLSGLKNYGEYDGEITGFWPKSDESLGERINISRIKWLGETINVRIQAPSGDIDSDIYKYKGNFDIKVTDREGRVLASKIFSLNKGEFYEFSFVADRNDFQRNGIDNPDYIVTGMCENKIYK